MCVCLSEQSADCLASVVYVRASTLEIEVTVVVQRPGVSAPAFTNTGYFTFIHFGGGTKVVLACVYISACACIYV